MNVLLNSITAMTMLHALILWEERKAFSAAVTVDILEMVSTVLVSHFPCTESLSNVGYNILFVDIDECTSDTDNCAEQATCIDNDGSFICTCNDGYTGNGMICDSEN